MTEKFLNLLVKFVFLASAFWVANQLTCCAKAPVKDKCPCVHDHKTSLWNCDCFWNPDGPAGQ